MSEVIVRMEMPEDCAFCPMAHWNKLNELTGCGAVSGKRYVPKDDEFWNVDRPSWCPIIGKLPPEHGELIDMRELLKRKMKMDWSVLEWVHEVDICNARVIVPATERSET